MNIEEHNLWCSDGIDGGTGCNFIINVCLVSDPPTDLASENITSTSFCITFNPPTNNSQNGAITSYTVAYQGELLNKTEYNITVSVNTVLYPLTESSSLLINGLEEYDNYTVLIRANNGAGEGAAAVIFVKTLESGLCGIIQSAGKNIEHHNIYMY